MTNGKITERTLYPPIQIFTELGFHSVTEIKYKPDNWIY